MPTQIIDGFTLNANKPIDTRMVTNGLASRNGIQYKYEGLRVYDITDKTGYVWVEGSWQTDGGGAGGAGGSVNVSGTPNTFVRFNEDGQGLTFSVVRQVAGKIGINVSTNLNYQLEVGGGIKASGYFGPAGCINGVLIESASLSPSKLTPMPNDGKTYLLKSINGNNQWQLEGTTTLNVSVTTDSQSEVGFLTFVQTINGQGSVLYANSINESRAIRIKPSTAQILGSIQSSATPGYSFYNSGASGMYHDGQNIGLTYDTKLVLDSTGSQTRLYVNNVSRITLNTTEVNVSSQTNISGGGLLATGTVTSNTGFTTTGTGYFGNNVTVDGAFVANSTGTINGALTVNANSNLNGDVVVKTGNVTIESTGFDKIFNITNVRIRALYQTNEFNFINNDTFTGEVYFNFRGANSTNAITQYRFCNGKGSGGTISNRFYLAQLASGGIISYGSRVASTFTNSALKANAAATFYADGIGLHLGAYNAGPLADNGYWIQTEAYADTTRYNLFLNPKGGDVLVKGCLLAKNEGLQIAKKKYQNRWTVSSLTSTSVRWASDLAGTTSGSFQWLAADPDADRIVQFYCGGSVGVYASVYVEESTVSPGYAMVARAEIYNSGMALIPAGVRWAADLQGVSGGNGSVTFHIWRLGEVIKGTDPTFYV